MGTIEDLMPSTDDEHTRRLAQLRKIMPDLFTSEGQIDEAELKKIIHPHTSETEHFDFRWFGKSNAKREAFTPTTATLEYDEARSVNPDTSENFIIEGENLQVLKLLKQGYRGTIKCIYIDPPYNTGKDFVYSDKWKTGKKEYFEGMGYIKEGVKLSSNPHNSGRYHSTWLSMMYSRLLASRDLLRDDGVILISIDDHEVHHLRKLCDEVFGEENFVCEFVWNTKKAAQGMITKNMVVANHEYLLAYSKVNDAFKFKGIKRKEDGFSNPDNDPRGVWKRQYLQRLGQGLPTRKITDPQTKKEWSFETPYAQDKLEQWVAENRIIFPKNKNNYPAKKEFLNEYRTNQQLITSLGLFATKATTEKLYGLFDNIKIFSNPKPDVLIKFFIEVTTSNNDRILDFFAGSGTTGDAVMQLNAEDGGSRNYILVQIPEIIDEKEEAYQAGFKTISDITIERNKRVIEKITKEGQENNEAIPTGLGFKVFKLTKSNFPRVEFAPNPELSEEKNMEMLKKYIAEKETQLMSAINKHSIITEIAIKNGMTLNYSVAARTDIIDNEVLLVSDENRRLHVCLDDEIREDTIAYLMAHTSEKFICLERVLNSTQKWNLHRYLKDNFKSY